MCVATPQQRPANPQAGQGSALDHVGSVHGYGGRGSPPEAIASPSPPPTRPRSFPVSPAHYYEAAATPGLARVRGAGFGARLEGHIDWSRHEAFALAFSSRTRLPCEGCTHNRFAEACGTVMLNDPINFFSSQNQREA